jgi:arylsulfatase A-like enzyme
VHFLPQAPIPRALRAILVALFLAAGCGGDEPGAPAPETPRELPPIVVFDIDTLRADHLGCYGYGRPTSPAIDAFAGESVRFHWAFSQGPNTPPSQTSIFTSLYPTTHCRFDDQQVVPESVVTLAEVLKEAGYATGAFVDGGLMASEFGLDQGFDLYDDEAGGVERIDAKARDWLRGHRDRPFFLLIHSYDVHSPYERTPEPWKSTFLDQVEEPSEEFRAKMTELMEKRRLSRYGDDPHALTPVQVEWARALYDGGIRHVDDWFGRFLAFLKEEGVFDRAILVFLSDHGDEFEEHDSVFHERIYASVTRIPLMIRFPGGRHREVVEEAVESIDLMPTLLEVLGLEPPAGVQGQSLLPRIRGEGELRELAISESLYFGRRVALATSDLRLVYTAQGGAAELYEYRRDPLEQRDVAAEHPAAVERLVRGVGQWQALVESQRHDAEEVEEMKDETLEQLRALGYLGD